MKSPAPAPSAAAEEIFVTRVTVVDPAPTNVDRVPIPAVPATGVVNTAVVAAQVRDNKATATARATAGAVLVTGIGIATATGIVAISATNARSRKLLHVCPLA